MLDTRLTFEPTAHAYTYDGVVVPGVTSLLAPLHDFGFVDKAVLEAACEFGRNAHEVIHLFNQDDLVMDSVSPPLMPWLTSYQMFLRDTGFKVKNSEVRVYHKTHRYAGQYDFDGEWKGTTWVVDVKTGVVPKTVGMQLAAYQNAMVDRPRQRMCLQLHDKGYKVLTDRPPTKWLKSTDWNDFVSILNYRRLIAEHNPRSLEQGYDALYPN